MTKINISGAKHPLSDLRSADSDAKRFSAVAKTSLLNQSRSNGNKAPLKLELAPTVLSPSAGQTEQVPVYETVEVLTFKSLLRLVRSTPEPDEKSLVRSTARDELTEHVADLLETPDIALPEIAIVNMEQKDSTKLNFNIVSVGDTIFISEHFFSDWRKGKDNNVFETALLRMLASQLRSSLSSGNRTQISLESIRE